MTNDQKDILGIVKELQSKPCECDKYETCWYCHQRAEAFPAIAQALTIAVDALEKTSNMENENDEWDGAQRFRDARDDASKALQKIRNLPAA